MEAIQMTMNSAQRAPINDLPMVLHEHKSVESIKGILKHRANPALRELEKGAWEQAAVEKYLEKMKDDCA